MQCALEHVSTLERLLRVSVPEEQIKQHVDEKLNSLRKKSQIAGFRPGRAPIAVIQSSHGKQVRQQVLLDMLEKSLIKALEQEQLRPVANPKIVAMEEDKGEGLSYTARFDIYPKIEFTALDKIPVEKVVCEISRQDIDDVIARLRREHANLQEEERAARQGDHVTVDYMVMLDGEKFAEQKDFVIEIGSTRFIEAIEQGLLGASANETREITATLPPFYPEKAAGKAGSFHITVKSVNTALLPELDGDFFSKLGIKAGDLEAFRAEIRQSVTREMERMVDEKLRQSVMEALYQHNKDKFDLPKSLVDLEYKNLLAAHQEQLKLFGVQADNVEPPKDLLELARRRITLQLVLREIVLAFQLEVHAQDLRLFIEQKASAYRNPEEMVRWYYQDQNRLAEMEMRAIEKKVVDKVLSLAKVRESAVTFEKLMQSESGRRTAPAAA